MGFLDKAKAAAEQAAVRAKEGVEDVQTKRNLSRAYEDLGRTAFDLIESGAISHERLTGQADEVRTLQAQAAEPVGAATAAPGAASAAPGAASTTPGAATSAPEAASAAPATPGAASATPDGSPPPSFD